MQGIINPQANKSGAASSASDGVSPISMHDDDIGALQRMHSLNSSERNDLIRDWLHSVEMVESVDVFDKFSDDEHGVADEGIFMARMVQFVSMSAHEMIESEGANQKMWNALDVDQKALIQHEIADKLESLEIILDEVAITEYIRSSFFQTESNIVQSIVDKNFVFALFPGFDDFINVDSRWLNKAISGLFQYLMNTISSPIEADIVFAHFKQYLVWINQSERLDKLEVHWFMLNGAIQAMLFEGHPVVTSYSDEFRRFIKWWFKVTGFRLTFHSSNCAHCDEAVERYRRLRIDHYPPVQAHRLERIHST